MWPTQFMSKAFRRISFVISQFPGLGGCRQCSGLGTGRDTELQRAVRARGYVFWRRFNDIPARPSVSRSASSATGEMGPGGQPKGAENRRAPVVYTWFGVFSALMVMPAAAVSCGCDKAQTH